jgi:hypothetical protein
MEQRLHRDDGLFVRRAYPMCGGDTNAAWISVHVYRLRRVLERLSRRHPTGRRLRDEASHVGDEARPQECRAIRGPRAGPDTERAGPPRLVQASSMGARAVSSERVTGVRRVSLRAVATRGVLRLLEATRPLQRRVLRPLSRCPDRDRRQLVGPVRPQLSDQLRGAERQTTEHSHVADGPVDAWKPIGNPCG